MYCVRKVTNDLYWVGANDHRLALFENCFPIPRGVSYNAYCLLDEKTVLFDTVDWSACRQLLENLAYVLDGRELDYLLVNHLEPDHAACIEEILLRHPKVKLISNEKAFMLMRQFGFHVDGHECIEVKEGDTFSFGKHTVTFVGAPMVHWPEAMVTLDVTDGVLFSADAFGTFGALNGNIFADQVDFERDWLDDARRYYTNIVGKYGAQVQSLLKRAAGMEIQMICPLHGPIWRENLEWFLEKYQRWSTYTPEDRGVAIFCGSIYGHTENAAEILAARLAERGVKNIALYDVSHTDVSYLVSEAFDIAGISKSPAIFDIDKLTYFNATYLRAMAPEDFAKAAEPYIREAVKNPAIDVSAVAALLQARCEKLTEIPEKVDFFDQLPDYGVECFTNKKSKTNPEVSQAMLEAAIPALEGIGDWTADAVHDTLIALAEHLGVKNATLMWPVRIAAAGKLVTPGGAVEICHILGKDETLRRLRLGLDKLRA